MTTEYVIKSALNSYRKVHHLICEGKGIVVGFFDNERVGTLSDINKYLVALAKVNGKELKAHPTIKSIETTVKIEE